MNELPPDVVARLERCIELRFSDRHIARRLDIDRKTVARYRRLLEYLEDMDLLERKHREANQG